jgi:murein DD-endopeptidase MepM/ murein hydrolase activator NlpD
MPRFVERVRAWSLPLPRLPRPIELTTDRRLAPLAVLGLLLVALVAASLPASAAPVGDTQGGGQAVAARIAALEAGGDAGPGMAIPSSDQVDPTTQALGDTYAADGTLLTPWAVTTSTTPAFTMRTYVVKAGDTLTGIASHFGLNMMSIWWANKLSSKDQLHIGQRLRIPPVDGVVYTVKDGDTLASIAAAHQADVQAIVTFNELATDEVTVGEQIMLPNGVGKPIPVAATPKPVSRPIASTRTAPGYTGSYSGKMLWPVPGGYISQYFHYGHWAIDIAAPYGTRVLAAAAGRVIFAGWRNNGGGWQVWISHGNNIYTTYNHMSSLTVVTGQTVARGQQVGRVGMTGDATGPHCHFEVWIGPIWNGGTRVNPLNYL